jgi:hypothetical protein
LAVTALTRAVTSSTLTSTDTISVGHLRSAARLAGMKPFVT